MNDVELYHGDCLDIMPGLEAGSVDAVIADPPYGMKWAARVTCGKNGHGAKGQRYSNYGATIKNDDKPFDPSPFLDYPKVILFGSNHYEERLPKGTTLVWIKRHERNYGKYLSDAEIAWQKGGHGVY